MSSEEITSKPHSITVYSYNAAGVYTGPDIAWLDPIDEETYLIPAGATSAPPPHATAGSIAVWDGAMWVVKPDHRGETWYRADGTPVTIIQVGVVPEPSWSTTAPPPPTSVPTQVTNFQARAALIAAGLFSQVDTAIKQSTDPVARQAWEYANDITRHGALVQSMATQLGLTSTQLDALFVQAAGISA